jgi:methylmalonyl-CoA mutase N-terminal domain/subunit
MVPRLSFLGDWDEPFYEIAKMRGRMIWAKLVNSFNQKMINHWL